MTIDKEMSFLDHLEIFRWHLIRAACAILFFSIIAFIFKDIVFDVILLGPRDPSFFYLSGSLFSLKIFRISRCFLS
jgi:sec-independent protein translocase protein TatC